VGVISGALLSPLSGNLMRKLFVAYTPSGSIARPDMLIILSAFVICTLIGIACSLYPGLRAANIVPMEVLRNE
jgi:ABC-type antimicrobial peptide transport system permease subunit